MRGARRSRQDTCNPASAVLMNGARDPLGTFPGEASRPQLDRADWRKEALPDAPRQLPAAGASEDSGVSVRVVQRCTSCSLGAVDLAEELDVPVEPLAREKGRAIGPDNHSC